MRVCDGVLGGPAGLDRPGASWLTLNPNNDTHTHTLQKEKEKTVKEKIRYGNLKLQEHKKAHERLMAAQEATAKVQKEYEVRAFCLDDGTSRRWLLAPGSWLVPGAAGRRSCLA